MNRPAIDSVSVDSLETSVLHLIKTCYRRQKWNRFFNPANPLLNTSSCRKILVKFLESTFVRGFSILLLILDLILTVLELSSSLLSCSNQRKNEPDEQIWYHWIGISVLTLLSVRMIFLAIGLGKSFLTRPGYVIDAVVLIAALFLEAFMEKKGGGLLVLASLWRVVRVVESAFELSDEAIEAQIEAVVCQFEELKEENRSLSERIAEKDVIIENLQEVIERLQELNMCKQGSDISK